MKRREPAWVRLSDEQLLDMRLCDLRLTVRGSPIEGGSRCPIRCASNQVSPSTMPL